MGCPPDVYTAAPTNEFARELARLLWAPLISAEVLVPGTNRDDYFRPCVSQGSLFLDPNTGIRDQQQADPPENYLFSADLVRLVIARPSFLTLVFDQSLQRGNEWQQVSAKLDRMRQEGVLGFSYVSHAAFLVVAQDRQLLLEARQSLVQLSRLPDDRFTAVT